MKDRMFGIESEYAFVAFDRAGNSLDRERSALMFFEGAQGKLVSLPDIRGRLFLENGSCLYIDCGPHPEFATPECTTPWEAVRYVKAGELILKSLTSVERVESNGARNFVLFRSNVDYSGARTTWGCHESYLHTADPGVLFEQILPHLVSRIIYTGSGGFDNRIRSVRFLLSPRVPHLVRAESDQSTIARGIWHSKDEPLCGNHRGYHRLHVLAGENLCSEKAIFLKVGTTALIVALIEAGMCPGDAVKLRNPVAAMRRFAASTDCTATAPLQGGGQATAIEIQSRYLEAVEANLGRDFMPAWAPRVCAEWRATLERLRDAPASVCTELDWAIKLTCFEHHIASRGVNWNDLNIPFLLSAHRGQIAGERLARLASMLEAFLGPDEDEIELEHDSLVCGSQPDNACVQRSVAEELFVMDLEFGRIGGGIFEILDDAGVLTHRLEGLGDVEAAVTEPPAAGRARVRGECVKLLYRKRGQFKCDWDHIFNLGNGKLLDLSDPFPAIASGSGSMCRAELDEFLKATRRSPAARFRRGIFWRLPGCE